jgi:hypothetical protein
MGNRILALIVALFILPFAALAQTEAIQIHGGHVSLVAPAVTPGSLKIVSPNGNAIETWVNGTKVSSVDASGQAVDQKYATGGFQAKFPVPPIITPATSFPTPPATPGTGSQVAERYNRVVTGAPTATFVQLPIGTPNVGKTYTVDNESANPAAIVPVSGDAINALAAATPYACAAGKVCDCFAKANALWSCTAR